MKVKFKYKLCTKETFVNPYNFVSCDYKNTVRRQLANNKTLHTGYFDCRLKTKTPLAIPENQPYDFIGEHPRYSYYSYEPSKSFDEKIPVIQGSSIRGTLRNVYEAASDSCFSTLRDASFLTGRTNQYNAYEPAILKVVDGFWKIFEATQYEIPLGHNGFSLEAEIEGVKKPERALSYKGEHFLSGDKVYFIEDASGGRRQYEGKVSLIKKNKSDKKMQEGILRIGEKFGVKNHASIFVEGNPLKCKGFKIAFDGLNKSAEDYSESSINSQLETLTKTNCEYVKHTGYSWYNRAKKDGCIPVFYTYIGDNGKEIFLSLSAIGRHAYHKSLNDIVQTKQACKSRENLCKACALFGTAEGEKLGSRIRITDAVCVNWSKDFLLEKEILLELGSPKPSYFDFYLSGNWSDASGYDSEQATIRGRKFYWHHNYQKVETGSSKRNATIDLIKENTEFKFRIYYDRVTEEQLKELIWTINFGENDIDGLLCHKTGHGKPLGLGSIKIVIEDQYERKYDEKWLLEKCDGLFEVKGNPFGEPSSKAYNELMKMVNFNTVIDDNVRYPYIYKADLTDEVKKAANPNDFAAHKWFLSNKDKRYNQGQNNKKLPVIMSSDLTHMPYEAIFDGGNGNSQGGSNNNGKGNRR